jgi:signal transduction histidine kinase
VKLLTKYSQVNILTAFVILLMSSLTYYFIIRHILLEQLDKDLRVEEQEIFDYVKERGELPNASVYKGQVISFERESAGKTRRTVESSTQFNKHEDEEEPVRSLTFPVTVNGIIYKATVSKSQVETEYLVKLIVLFTGGIFLLLLMLTTVINRFVLNKLWQPFYHTLNQLSQFNLSRPEQLDLPPTNLSEFAQLNTSVVEMTKRVSGEFESLKAFADNASHEMQTPLAIINSKLDLLIQTSTRDQADLVQAIYNATGRLSKLNQTLLLLTKIDNEQYISKETFDLKALLGQKFQQFDELLKGREITLTYIMENVCLSLNKELADILLNNLLSNAIKHNYKGGHIHCTLTQQEFALSNSGPALTFSENDIFNRFQKSERSDGTGLGLAVVKQICQLYNLNIRYSYSGSDHNFTVILNQTGT